MTAATLYRIERWLWALFPPLAFVASVIADVVAEQERRTSQDRPAETP